MSALDSITFLEQTSSTNLVAREMAKNGAPDRSGVVANEQTSGRGRAGRTWHSPPNKNLYLSQIVRDWKGDSRLLACLAAVAVREAIALHLPNETSAEIKWPNDILVDGLKLAGVLAEVLETPATTVILGFGVNLNMSQDDFPSDLRRPAGSLCMFTKTPIERDSFLTDLLTSIERWRQLEHHQPGSLIDEYRKHCLSLGRRALISPIGKKPWLGTIHAVDTDGILVVTDENGNDIRIEAGDVDLLT